MATRTRRLDVQIGSEAKGDGFKKAEKDADAFGKKMKSVSDKIGQHLGDGVDEGAKGLTAKLRKASADAASALDSGVKKGAAGIGATLQGAGATASDAFASGFDIGGIVDDASGVLSGLPGKLGTVAGGAGIAVAGAFAIGFEESLDREMSTDRLAAQIRLTGAEAERVGAISGELFADAYGESVDEVNLALRSIHTNLGDLSTFSDDQITDMAAKALDFANVFDVDVNRSVRGVGQLIRNDLADDATAGFDLIFAAASRLPAEFGDELIESIEEYGTDFQELGLTGSQALGMIVAAVESGTRNVDLAADSLREFSDIMIEGGEGAAGALEGLGINAGTAFDAIAAGGQPAQDMTFRVLEGLEGVADPRLRDQIGRELFGTKWLDAGEDGILAMGDMRAGLADVAGAAEEAGDTVNDNLGTRWTELKRNVLDKLVTFIDERLIPVLQDVSGWAELHLAPAVGQLADDVEQVLMPALRSVAGFFEDNPWAVKAVLALVGLGGAFAAISGIIGFLIPILQGIGVVFGFVGFVATLLGGIVVNSFGVMLGPIGLAALAIWKLRDVISGVKDWIFDRIGDIVGFVKDLPGRIADAADGMWDGITGAFKDAINTIIRAWNRLSFTIGGGSYDPLGRFGPAVTVPAFTFNTPNIPTLHEGGEFSAPTGRREGLAMLLDGEVVYRPGQDSGGGSTVNLTVNVENRGVMTTPEDVKRWLFNEVNNALAYGQINVRGRRL